LQSIPAPKAQPNQRVQPTPLRGPEIVAILKADFVSIAIPIYRGGAADARHVGPPSTHTAVAEQDEQMELQVDLSFLVATCGSLSRSQIRFLVPWKHSKYVKLLARSGFVMAFAVTNKSS
jgi:hypothetical protein